MGSAEAPTQSEVSRLLQLDTTPWYQKPNLRNLYLCLVPAALGVEMTSGYDGSILNGLQAVGPWLEYFNDPQGALLGVINAAFGIGAVLVLPIVPWFNDKYGRKHSITLGSIIIVIAAILQGTSVHVAMFLISRLLLGMGIPFSVSGASQLIAELSYPREAAVLNGLFNESWYAGAILAAATTLESPRWLMSKDRDEEAFEILVKYHAEGRRDDTFVNAEFSEIKNRMRHEKENAKHKWSELLKTSGNRKRTFIAVCVGLFSQWSGNGLVSYYLARVLRTVGINDFRTQNIINLGLTCWNLATGIPFSFLTSYMPRRTQYMIAFVGMTLSFAIWTGVSADYVQQGHSASAKAVVAMIFVYYLFYTMMHPLTYIYITELFPFVHRAKGVGLTQTFSRGGAAFNLFVNPIGMQNIGWKLYIVYVVWLAVESTIIFFVYPETKGPTLEELGQLFEDGDSSKASMKEKELAESPR